MVLSKSLILRFFCRFVGKNVTKFLCYIDLLKVTKLTRLLEIGLLFISLQTKMDQQGQIMPP